MLTSCTVGWDIGNLHIQFCGLSRLNSIMWNSPIDSELMNQMIKSICIYLFITHIACMYKLPLLSRESLGKAETT